MHRDMNILRYILTITYNIKITSGAKTVPL